MTTPRNIGRTAAVLATLTEALAGRRREVTEASLAWQSPWWWTSGLQLAATGNAFAVECGRILGAGRVSEAINLAACCAETALANNGGVTSFMTTA